jgi:hypothetical protein
LVQGTNHRDITGRLTKLLGREGFKTMTLKSDTVATGEREGHILSHQDQIDGLICHPKLVQTGLDLYEFVSIVFYQVETSAYVTRQASRRSWRLGQTREVECVYMAYQQTAQTRALALIANKAARSLAFEGDLSSSGLEEMAEEDTLVSLARSLSGVELEYPPIPWYISVDSGKLTVDSEREVVSLPVLMARLQTKKRKGPVFEAGEGLLFAPETLFLS